MEDKQQNFEKISFYIVPHADDWQLFMQPNVLIDLVAAKCKTVFIITTAGDAGKGEKYWRAREEGCKSSVRFCLAQFGPTRECNGSSNFGKYYIHYWRINDSITYFLRLPDGNTNGAGFAASNFDGLSKLQSGKINTIKSVDSTTFHGNWPDLLVTIESIISFERRQIMEVNLNYLNPDVKENPGDHSDHVSTGHAVQGIATLKKFKHLLFSGYNVGSDQLKLSAHDLFWKIGMFAAYEQKVQELCGYSTLQEDVDLYVKWCSLKACYRHLLSMSSVVSNNSES